MTAKWRWLVFVVAFVPVMLFGVVVEDILDHVLFGNPIDFDDEFLAGIWIGMLLVWAMDGSPQSKSIGAKTSWED